MIIIYAMFLLYDNFLAENINNIINDIIKRIFLI